MPASIQEQNGTTCALAYLGQEMGSVSPTARDRPETHSSCTLLGHLLRTVVRHRIYCLALPGLCVLPLETNWSQETNECKDIIKNIHCN